MMNTLQLQLLDATLRRQPVLSVYLPLTAPNPLDRKPLLLGLRHELKRWREKLGAASHAEREAFERCAGHLEPALNALPQGLTGETWVAFATPAGVSHSGIATTVIPTVFAWGEGIRLAPYLRLMKDDLPAVVVICDAAHADLWEYRGTTSRLVERIHAHHSAPHESSRLGAAAPPGFHPGTRGATGHDEMQRQKREGTRRMLALVARRASELAGPDGLICLGGIAQATRELAASIPKPDGRVHVVQGLDVHATGPQVTAAAVAALQEARDRRDADVLAETMERAAPAGFGVLGPTETSRALECGRVKELFVSDRYLLDHLEEAEWSARHAQRQGARVSILTGASATRLDEQGGVAAWLRYRLDGSAKPQRTA